MKDASLVVRATVDGKRINLSPEQAKARNLSGTFYMRWTEDGKDKWVSVGKDVSAAKVAVIRKEREFRGIASTMSEVTLQEAIDAFIVERTASQDASSVRRWQWELDRYASVTGKTYLGGIDRMSHYEVCGFGGQVSPKRGRRWRRCKEDRRTQDSPAAGPLVS